MKKVLILINKITDAPTEDELDVLDQVCEVEEALAELGYESHREFLDLNLQSAKSSIQEYDPELVFNLVETVDGKGDLIFLAPALLESMNIPFTGCGLKSMFITSDKTMAKEIMRFHGISTADWFDSENLGKLSPQKTYLVKPQWEDGSVGIDDDAVFKGNDPRLLEFINASPGRKFFVEEYIHGREFNLSILGGENGPEVLAPAEIKFINFPKGKPKIIGYRSKWDESSFEYQNTLRTFDFPDEDLPLLERLDEICYQCWELFDLKGYARVDFRVNEKNEPFVLEINANPCISPDAGFYAACGEAGYKFHEVIERIMYDARL
ncbi:MAG: ATP-grasp domain-containing protein [Bacteroidales bacterium]